MARGLSERELMLTDFNKLGDDIKRLKAEQKLLINQQNRESAKLSELVEKEIKIKADADKLVSDAKDEAKGIISKAKGREEKVMEVEAELERKIARADESMKRSDNLIKSNSGKENNLLAEKEDVAKLKAKLIKVLEMIKDVV